MKDKDCGEEGKSARQEQRGRLGQGGGQKARRPAGEAGGGKQVRSPPWEAAPPGAPGLLRAEASSDADGVTLLSETSDLHSIFTDGT